MNTNRIDLALEVRSSNGTSTEYYQSDRERIREALHMLAAPRLFAQPHLLLASEHCASMIPSTGIDMIFARTSARTPLKFPVDLPMGLFDIVMIPQVFPDGISSAIEVRDEREHGRLHRRGGQFEILTLGGWAVNLKVVAEIRGNVEDERHLFAHLPEVPTIPFRLEEGGFGLINTANIVRATAWPRPKALPGSALPLELRQWTPSRIKSPENLVEVYHL